MAQENQGTLQTLKHTLGLERGQLTPERLGRWIGTFILFSAVVLAIWALFSPSMGVAGGSFETRIRAFWTTLVTTSWSGIAIILLVEMLEVRRYPEIPARPRRTNESSE